MKPERERQLLASLYDRLFDAIAYSPDGKSAPFDRATSYIQMAKNVVLDPAEFENMLSPSNPNGDMRSAAAFSALVDALPEPQALWADSGRTLSGTYSNIVNGANSQSTVTESQQKIYQQAYDYLNTQTETKDFKGDIKTKTQPSDIAIAYDDNQAAYITAVGGYRTAFNGYDLDEIADQRAWNAVAPGLQLTVDQAWNKWNREGKSEVEEAQNALVSTINDAVRNAIAQGQQLVNEQHQLAPATPTGNPWLPSYGLPTNWASSSIKGSKLTFKSSYLDSSASSEATSYAASASGSWGLWHASGGVSGGSQEETANLHAEDLTLEAELLTVLIKRPWYNPLLFAMKNWFTTASPIDGISNGKPNGAAAGAMPLVPTAFVVARDVKISADFRDEDKSFISKSISTKASAGWGPFSVSGSYSHSKSESSFSSKFDGGTLELPGLQLIAWVSAVTPASPPEKAP